MARIELRDCTIRFKDGLAGTAALTSPPALCGCNELWRLIPSCSIPPTPTRFRSAPALLWRRKPAHRLTSS